MYLVLQSLRTVRGLVVHREPGKKSCRITKVKVWDLDGGPCSLVQQKDYSPMVARIIEKVVIKYL